MNFLIYQSHKNLFILETQFVMSVICFFVFLLGVFQYSDALATTKHDLSINAVTQYEWAEILSGSTGQSIPDFTSLSDRILDEAGKMMGSEKTTESFQKFTQSCVLSWYIMERLPIKGNNDWYEYKKKITELRAVLERAGMKPQIFTESLENLVISTNFSKNQKKINKIAEGKSTISVNGIVPGISTEWNVGFVLPEDGFVIGGYKMTCKDSYDTDGTIDQLLCLFGEKVRTRDLADSENLVTNNIVYLVLHKGFEKKFGHPKIKSIPMRSKLGAHYTKEVSTWTDQTGNKLEIMSIMNTIDEGALVLTSGKKNKADAIKTKAADKIRIF